MPDITVPSEQCDWNALLGASNIFHEEINEIQSKSNDKTEILSELHDLLHQDGVLQTLFNKFLIAFEVEIENSESRREIFANNLVQIAAHNIDAQNGRNTWFQTVNQFTYLSDDEFKAEYITLPAAPRRFKLRKMYANFCRYISCSCINRKKRRTKNE